MGKNRYMERNTNVDIVRSICIILIIAYHCYIIVGNNIGQNLSLISPIMNLGGEIGVTLFFILSGFGIFKSLSLMESKDGNINFRIFLKKRLRRIYPQYMLCLIFLLIFTSNAVYFSKEGLFHIISHFMLLHNLFYNTHGSINGALWTMGVIFQFYIFAPILYKYIKKNDLNILIVIFVTILFKYILYSFLSKNIFQGMYYFIYGRQFFTSIDNFALGMFFANIIEAKKYKVKFVNFFGLTLLVAVFFILIYKTNSSMIYTNSIVGYIWHSILAIVLGFILFFSAILPELKFKNVRNILIFISKYQYGIYLWHLIIINNLLQYSTIFKSISENSLSVFTIIIFMISTFVGVITTIMVDLRVPFNKNIFRSM